MHQPEVTLAQFVEYLRFANPFDDNRVTQADSLTGDIPSINDAAFEQLKLHARKACHSDKGRGVVISGSPGIGKSHLLARFGRWARDEKYPFIYLLNLQAGPQDILRTILRTSISILSRDFHRAPQRSRLYKLISMAIREAIAKYAPGELLTLKQCRIVYEKMLSEQNDRSAIYDVLWDLFEDVQRRIMKMPATGRSTTALKWLSGDYLDPEEAGKLSLKSAVTTEDGCVLSLEDMKDVLRILCRFAAYRDRSFILCFDQVDTLAEDQVQTWSATVHALLDLCPGLLVVTSGVDETFLRWTSRDLVSKASWDDRIRQFPLLLSGIDAASGRQLILSRLQSFAEQFDTLPEVASRRLADQFFPIGKKAVDRILQEADGTDKNDMRPRDVICRAGVAWDKQASIVRNLRVDRWLDSWSLTDLENANASAVHRLPPEPGRTADDVIQEKIEQHKQARKRRPEELPVDAGNLTGLLKNILTACMNSSPPFRQSLYGRLLGLTYHEQRGTTKPPFQLIIEHFNEADGSRSKTGVTICEATSGLPATNMLKRMQAQLAKPDSVTEAILVVDARRPLSLAAMGQNLLTDLQKEGQSFSIVTLSSDEYAALDALESVVGLARAGDLEVTSENGSSRSISDDEVYESHHRCGRYASSPVIGRLIGQTYKTTTAHGNATLDRPQRHEEAVADSQQPVIQ